MYISFMECLKLTPSVSLERVKINEHLLENEGMVKVIVKHLYTSYNIQRKNIHLITHRKKIEKC